MSLAITIELSDDDLKYFADAMQSAQKESQNLSPQEITDAASKLLQDGKDNKLPAFISDRLSRSTAWSRWSTTPASAWKRPTRSASSPA